MKKTLLPLFIILIVTCSTLAQTIELFNGKNLNNWNFVVEKNQAPPADVFKVENNMIHITGTPFGYMYTKDTYSNFKLHVEWKWLKEATNSGIFLFVHPDKKSNPNFVWPNAIECQLAAGAAGDFVLLNGSDIKEFVVKKGEKRPAFPVVKKYKDSVEMPIEEWNNADIICQKGEIIVYINGVLMNKGTKSLHKSGHIGLQSEGKDILFRNIRLTPIN